MAKQSTGFITTIPNFLDVIDILKSLGTAWNPIDDNLSIPKLQARHDAALLVMDDFKVATEFDKIKTSERETAYEPLNGLVSRILAAAKACKMDDATIDDISTYKNLIDGSNITKIAVRREQQAKKEAEKQFKLTGIKAEDNAENGEDDKRSVSRQAYAARYDNFKNLITLLTTAGTYKTNVEELTLNGLNAYLVRLATANKATNDADKALSKASELRDAALRAATDSICSVVKDIKTELVTLESKSGSNYKKVCDIKFMPTKK